MKKKKKVLPTIFALVQHLIVVSCHSNSASAVGQISIFSEVGCEKSGCLLCGALCSSWSHGIEEAGMEGIRLIPQMHSNRTFSGMLLENLDTVCAIESICPVFDIVLSNCYNVCISCLQRHPVSLCQTFHGSTTVLCWKKMFWTVCMYCLVHAENSNKGAHHHV